MLQLDNSIHRLTVREYMSLDVIGRTELLEGIIYDMSPRNDPHRFAVNVFARVLQIGLGSGYTVQSQDAIFLDGWTGKNAPEPDIAVIENSIGHVGHPTSENVRVVIEVCDTTYEHDRRKIALFVNAHLTAYIVNIEKQQVERYGSQTDLSRPHGAVFAVGDTFDVLNVVVSVADLFAHTPS